MNVRCKFSDIWGINLKEDYDGLMIVYDTMDSAGTEINRENTFGKSEDEVRNNSVKSLIGELHWMELAMDGDS